MIEKLCWLGSRTSDGFHYLYLGTMTCSEYVLSKEKKNPPETLEEIKVRSLYCQANGIETNTYNILLQEQTHERAEQLFLELNVFIHGTVFERLYDKPRCEHTSCLFNKPKTPLLYEPANPFPSSNSEALMLQHVMLQSIHSLIYKRLQCSETSICLVLTVNKKMGGAKLPLTT